MMPSEMAAIIETVILQQLHSFEEDLTGSQRKLIAHQSAMEAARRICSSEPQQLAVAPVLPSPIHMPKL
jgi:hypothetical protein